MAAPVEKIRDGNVSASIFENTSVKGKFRSATFQLRYKDKEDGEWKDGKSYGVKDVESLIKVATEARDRLQKKSGPKSESTPA